MKDSRKILLVFGDLLALTGGFFLTLYIGYWGNITPQIIDSHVVPFIIMYIFWLITAYIFNLYDYSFIRPTINNIKNISSFLIVSGALGAIMFYLIPFFEISPKSNLLINILVFGLLFISWRRIFFSLFSKYFRKEVLIIGKNPRSEILSKEIDSNPHIGYKFAGFVESIEEIPNEKIFGAVILAKDFKFETKQIHRLMSNKIEILNIIEAYEKIFSKIPIDFINEDWFTQNIKDSGKDFYLLSKRIFDVVISSITLITTLPIMLIVAIFIKIEDGRGVIYKQKRIGLYNKPFYLYKFQTYIAGAEKNGAEWSKENDPRITRFGKILRKTHMDELPQVINVLKGDLSLVGPRPERPEFVETLEKEVPYFDLRHIIKPGVTGWAQVKFKYAGTILESYQKFEYDMFYAKNQNFYMDLGIIFRTIQKIFK